MKFCNKDIFDRIDEYIFANKDRIVEDLLELVRIPSVQSEPKPGAPFGEECARILTATTEMYKRHGFDGKINYDGGYAISYYGKEGGKTIGLFSHGDVVPADGEWLMCKPFEPAIKDGYIFGRGCNDDKSGIIETIYAAEIIRELGFDFKGQLVMFTGANEESGMKDIEAFVKNEPMPDVSIVADGGYPCYCGERSTLRFILTSKKSFDRIRKIYGGKAFNITLGEVTAEIEYGEALWNEIQSACRENERTKASVNGSTITVTACGISTHTGAAAKSLNACKILAEMLIKCNSLGASDKQILNEILALLRDVYGTGFGIVHCDKDFGQLICANGIIDTTEDGKAALYFDIRAGLSYNLEEMRTHIVNASEKNWDYDEKRCSPGYLIPDDNPLRMLIEDTYAAVSGITGTVSEKISGGTHSRHLENAISVGTVGYYKTKPIDLPEGHGGEHQPDEKISIDGLLEAIKILVCMIMELQA